MNETNIFVEFNTNPFIFDNVSLLEYNFYLARIVNTMEEKAKEQEEQMKELQKNKGRSLI